MEQQNDGMRAGAGCEIEDGVEPRVVADDVGRFHRSRKVFVARRIRVDEGCGALRAAISGAENQQDGGECGGSVDSAKKIRSVHGATLCRILCAGASEKFAEFGTATRSETAFKTGREWDEVDSVRPLGECFAAGSFESVC